MEFLRLVCVFCFASQLPAMPFLVCQRIAFVPVRFTAADRLALLVCLLFSPALWLFAATVLAGRLILIHRPAAYPPSSGKPWTVFLNGSGPLWEAGDPKSKDLVANMCFM